jgi:sulfatase modifying factor 1
MTKLFISYRSLDSIKVNPLVGRLASLIDSEKKPLYQLWQDKKDIVSGEDWWKAILAGIDDCDVFIFMVSRESVKNKHCRAEIKYARDVNRPILPVVLEGEWSHDQARTKDDINYWEDVPKEIIQPNTQFLFDNNGNAIDGIQKSVNRFLQERAHGYWKPRKPMPHPLPESEVGVDGLYQQAVDAALRKNFQDAIYLFDRVGRWDSRYLPYTERWINVLQLYEHYSEAFRAKDTPPAILQAYWSDYEDLFADKLLKTFYDPDNWAADSRLEPQIRKLMQSLNAARMFQGKQNREWKPIIQKLGDIDPASPLPDLELCLVPVGKFTMGSNQHHENERAAHVQEINQAYWIGRYPITNAQWRVAVEAQIVDAPKNTLWYKDAEMADAPVVYVDWFQSEKFARWLNCSLPTEVLWEYAARGVEGWSYPWGNDWDNGNRIVWLENSNGKPNSVMSKPEGASWVGALHLCGNIWEWQLSEYRGYPYQSEERRTIKFSALERSLRGSSWGDYGSDIFRAAFRHRNHPQEWGYAEGLRICRLSG